MNHRRLSIALSCAALVGCGDDDTRPAEVVHPTLVAVSPDDFRGNVPCLNGAGALRSYVATLFDVTEDLFGEDQPSDPFELPSSGVVPCEQDVGFAYVVPGHRYVSEVAAFDRTDLESLAPGSPWVVAAESGEIVKPRWTARCGRIPEGAGGVGNDGAGGGAGNAAATDAGAAGGAGAPPASNDDTEIAGVTARSTQTVYTDFCTPLRSNAPPSATNVEVDVRPALDRLSCGDAEGQVDRFEATLLPAGPTLMADCGKHAMFQAVTPGSNVELRLRAFEAGSDSARWQTLCFATARDGVTVRASCDPLVQVSE